MAYNWLDIIQKSLFPETCLLCGNPGFDDFDLCQSCFQTLPQNHAGCPVCAAPCSGWEQGTTPCGRCQKQPPAFDSVRAPYLYTGEIRYLIQSLKYHQKLANARLLGQLLVKALQTADYRSGYKPDCILPVPLHNRRYRERGFNQAAEIARIVAGQMNMRLLTNSCRRLKDTRQQTDLTAGERKKNLKYAFKAEINPAIGHVVILDDVLTTGSTADEMARTLRRAGIKKIDVWVCARA